MTFCHIAGNWNNKVEWSDSYICCTHIPPFLNGAPEGHVWR